MEGRRRGPEYTLDDPRQTFRGSVFAADPYQGMRESRGCSFREMMAPILAPQAL